MAYTELEEAEILPKAQFGGAGIIVNTQQTEYLLYPGKEVSTYLVNANDTILIVVVRLDTQEDVRPHGGIVVRLILGEARREAGITEQLQPFIVAEKTHGMMVPLAGNVLSVLHQVDHVHDD